MHTSHYAERSCQAGFKSNRYLCRVSVFIGGKKCRQCQAKKARRQSDRADPALSGCQHATDEYSYCPRACVCVSRVCVLCVCACLSARAWLLADSATASGTIRHQMNCKTETRVKSFLCFWQVCCSEFQTLVLRL